MSTDLSPGVVVAGRYRLDRLLGIGGMGQVWAVTHEVTHRVAALKLLNGPSHLKDGRRRRFLREARAASAVQHPNVVAVHDFFELDDGTPVMIMDLLEGETLGRKMVREGPMPLGVAAAILLPVISAVGTAHARGVIHRDLKPENVFLCTTPSGFDVRVLDFGVAKLVGAAAPGGDDSDALTGGGLVGTPLYMSPEQGFGEDGVDHRTDVWALGVMLYEMLSGVRPLDGVNVWQVLKRLMNEAILPIAVLVPELPADVASLVDRMLLRDKTARPNDLREVRDVLARHAAVVVPAFGAAVEEASPPLDSSPLSGRSSPQAAVEPPAVVASPGALETKTDVEPLGPTVLAPSPSLDARATAKPSARSRALLAAVAVFVAAAALAVTWSLRTSNAALPARRAPPSLAALPVAQKTAATPTPTPAMPSPEQSVTAPLTEAESPAASRRKVHGGRVQQKTEATPPEAPPAPSARRGGLVDEPPF